MYRFPGQNTARISLIDGLRGLSVLWMVSFHAIFFFGSFSNREAYEAFIGRFWPTLFNNGHFGVDIFFVISGFLIADILLREWERTGRISFRSFYIRRAFRILPLYAVFLVLCTALGLNTVWQMLPNLVFLNNFLPWTQQAMVWCWSLAIEEQFYFVFPLLLTVLALYVRDTAKIIWAYAALIVLSVGTTAALLVRYRIFSSPAIHPVLGESFGVYFDTVYAKTYCRIGGILLGIIVAYCRPHRNPKPWSAGRVLSRRILMYGAVALILVCAFWPREEGPDPSPAVVVVFFATYRILFAGAVAIVLLCGLRPELKRDPVVRFLSWPVWILFAELSYGAYLVHPLVAGAAYKYFFSPDWIARHNVMWPVLLTEVVTFSIAFGTYLAIERPMREWGRRLAQHSSR